MINVQTNINWSELEGRFDTATRAAQFMLDSDVLKDSNYYIPKDTGNSERSGIIHSQLGYGKIVWRTPYIRKIYYGTSINFHKDINPNAQDLWFEAAKASKKERWIVDLRNLYRQYFNG